VTDYVTPEKPKSKQDLKRVVGRDLKDF